MLPGRSNKQICNKLKIEDNSFSLIIICLLYVNTIVYVNYMSIQNWASLVAQDGKASACNAGDLGSIPDSGISPGERNGNPLQYSCLGNPMDRGTWWATAHGVTKSQTRLSDFISLSIITLNVDGLNAPVKKDRVTEWIKKNNVQLYVASKRLILALRTEVG